MDKERRVLLHREFYTRLISREHPLPEAFVPEHLIDIGLPFEAAPGDPKRLLEYQAAKAASQLFHACHRCGLNLWAVSGYRSYQRQKELLQEVLSLQSQEQVSTRADLLWMYPALPSIWSSPKGFPQQEKAAG